MKLLSAIVARNEADRYLSEVLAQCLAISDHVILWDDGSTDNTAQLAANMGCEVWRTDEPRWAQHEGKVREALYEKALKHNPTWLYTPDADEVLECPEKIAGLLTGEGPYKFDMWHAWESRDHFRRDGLWIGQHATRLFRVSQGDGHWYDMPLHCGSAPACVLNRPQVECGLRIFHLGYAQPGDPLAKYARYSMLDPNGAMSPQSHYDSMLTEPLLTERDGTYISGPRG